MNDPPKPGSPQDPLCKICHKPLRAHSFQEQQECAEKIRETEQLFYCVSKLGFFSIISIRIVVEWL